MSKQLTKTELTDIRSHWWQCRHTPPSRMSVTGVDAVGEHLVSVVELVVWSPESMRACWVVTGVDDGALVCPDGFPVGVSR